MTPAELRDKALNKYVVGQVINLRYRNPKGKITERRKAEVVKFFKHFVLCEVDKSKECFVYADLETLTKYHKEET